MAKPKQAAPPQPVAVKAPAKVAAAPKAAAASSVSSGELKSLQEENQRLQGQVWRGRGVADGEGRRAGGVVV